LFADGAWDALAVAEADWGVHEQAADFGIWGKDWVAVDSDDAADVDEVAAAREQGWFVLTEAPLWCFIPSVWPREARAWVRDRRVRHAGRQPWTAADYFEIEDDYNGLLERYGLPPRPGGRIWVLRPPEGFETLDAVLADIWAGWRAKGGEDPPGPGLVAHAARRLEELFRFTE
jgi:hypothetical protein